MNPIPLRTARGRRAAWVTSAVVLAALAGCGQPTSNPKVADASPPTAPAAVAPTPDATVAPAGPAAVPPPVQVARAGQPVPAAAPPYPAPAPSTQAQGYPTPGYAPAPPQPGYAPPPAYPNQAVAANTSAYTPPPGYELRPIAEAAPARPVARVRTAAPAVANDRIGRVAAIEPIHERPQGTGAGGALGGVLGGVVGNQFGHGTGRAALTVLGAVGGAVAGNNVERNVRERVVGYRISVRLDDGESRSIEEGSIGDLRVGDRVRVDAHGVRRV